MKFFDKDLLSKVFKTYRKRSGLTQEQLSEKINIAEKHYGKLERGLFYPSIETFFKLVEVLNIPLSEFGFETEIINNFDSDRKILLKEIYTSNSAEIKLILNFINSLKTYNKDVKEL